MIHHCPNCLKRLKSEDVDIKALVAVCSNCGKNHQLNALTDLYKKKSKPEVYLPEHFEELPLSHQYIVSYRWFSKKVYPLIFFALLWNGIILFMINQMIDEAPFAIAFMFFHMIVGFGMIYYILMLFFNRTTISLDQKYLEIKHSPLAPFYMSNMKIATHKIKQFYVSQKISNKKKNKTYNLNMIYNEGRKKAIIKYLDEYQYARYLEQKIETYLKIEDQDVPKEFKK